ncbi:MAG TPA: PilZ domain-containing protein [Pyrinomonadaceae bacterium]
MKDEYRQERGANLRRNRRVRMRFPVRVEVPVEEGRTRVLQAHTVVVSHAGATLDVDEPIPEGMGLQVSPPFGGSLLAEVNGVWVDGESGRHRVSIRLLDPLSWTAPERFAADPDHEPERVNVRVHPWLWQMLGEYTAYRNETSAEASTLDGVAEGILERALLADVQFQKWFATKITEDIEAWEECAPEG